MRFVAATLIAVGILAAVPPAWGQTSDPIAAEALFRQGREAMKQGDYKTACPKFRESQRLDPGAGTLINLAMCEEKQGLLASSWQHFQEAADQLEPEDERRAIALDGVKRLQARVPRLKIVLPDRVPAGTVVEKDGMALGAASLGTALPIDPGEHVIVVRAPGRASVRRIVNLAEGEAKTLEVAPGVVEPRAESQASSRDSSTSEGNETGYVIGGLGLVALGVSGYFALDARSKDEEALKYCSGTECWDQRGVDLTNDSRDASKLAIGAGALGGAAVLTGLLMILSGSPSSESEPVDVSARATTNGGSVWLGGAF